MREVLLRTDLWSDQILVLRAVQTLTMLDVQHNCDLVWSLGGYTRQGEESGFPDDRGGVIEAEPRTAHAIPRAASRSAREPRYRSLPGRRSDLPGKYAVK